MKNKRKMGIFLVGGGAYVGLELLWRRRSHSSMFLSGGVCLLLLGKIRESLLPKPVKPLAGAGMITLVELAVGLLVNRDYRVWDYRALPGNFRGQICLPFSLLWIPLSGLGMWLYGILDP